LINIREKIRKDIIALQKDSKVSSENPSIRIQSLEDEYERVQQQIIEIDREIRELELARAGARKIDETRFGNSERGFSMKNRKRDNVNIT